MTAEIVVMNTGGIAIAADSAVTIGRGRKVYNSANKLFSFSKYHPVGVMTYGLDSLLQVPWETLIKVFRNELDDRCFDTLKEYSDAFINFLNQNEYKEFMSESSEADFISGRLESEVRRLYRYLFNLKEDLYSEFGDLYIQNEIHELYIHHGGHFLGERLHKLLEKEYIAVFNDRDFNLLIEKYGKELEQLIHEQFEHYMIIDDWIEDIKCIVIHTLLKQFSSAKSGVVFAGFGEKEIYPSAISFHVEGKINGKLKYSIVPHQSKSINHSLIGTILPFAQSDMVDSFITGIHRKNEDFLHTILEKELEVLPHILTEKLKDQFKVDIDMETIEESIETELLGLYRTFNRQINQFKRRNFIEPVINIVGTLPMVELAHMAEALLNITSFKNKMSPSIETVGGPIDVAVITKGDGFTWVKRK